MQYELRDPVLDAMTDLERALEENLERSRLIQERIEEVRAARARGHSYTEIAPRDSGPAIVRLITENANALNEYGVRLRRAAARALYDEGLTMDQIADVFGVTRQRVSTLLKADGG